MYTFPGFVNVPVAVVRRLEVYRYYTRIVCVTFRMPKLLGRPRENLRPSCVLSIICGERQEASSCYFKINKYMYL